MPMAVLWSLLLIASLAVLVKGADVFVEQAARVARALGVPEFLIGVTLVALGTSLPELAASLSSVTHGPGHFVAGTVVGSNVANILFILGAAALAFKGFKVSRPLLEMDVPVMLTSAVLLSIMAYDGQISRIEGLFLLVFYVVYLLYAAHAQKSSTEEKQGGFKPIILLWLALAGAAIYAGAEFTVLSVIKLTELIGLSDTSVLALTVVAVGSSLPELVVTLTAAKKQYHDLSVGNVVGSNICNTFLVTGVPALVKPLPVSQAVIATGLPFMLAASLMLLAFAAKGQVGRHAGVFFILVFILFLFRLTGLA